MSTHNEKSERIIRIFKRILPSPLTIAILLSIFTLLLAQFLTKPEGVSHGSYFVELVTSWESGLWDSSGGGLYFAFQMMLILVLGHVLALTPAIDKLIQALLNYCTTTANSAVVVALGSISLGLINWGLGLIFGAIIARKVGEKFAKLNKPLNYGLIGGAGYATMMTWHMGLSGSATTKSMESGYIQGMMDNAGIPGDYPDFIPFEATIGSTMNIVLIIVCLVLIPLTLYLVAKRKKNESVPVFKSIELDVEEDNEEQIQGAERIDYSKFFGIGLGSAFLIFAVYKAVTYSGVSSLGFIHLNFINFTFLGLALILHKNIVHFSNALQVAVGDVSGILIQFPFYFGILAIMSSSGLITLLSDSITSVANAYTLPELTYLSAGVVNFFIPSGGGQWAVQGPIIIESVQRIGADLPKSILAMAYGDQLTNMLQPFWALPLLGITKLKPHQLLPYSFLVFLVGLIIFGVGLLVF
ncbi:MAG: TIGR00366 family protein [Crocinitomicaceae bacterium]|nr:TIGR00366 family protein [Crocinitomicaceae bacterium]